MNTRTLKLSSTLSIPLGIIAGLALGYYLFAKDTDPRTEFSQDTATSEIWTCSMHPQVQLLSAGPCPICGMDLIPLEAKQDHGGGATLALSPTARALA